MLWIDHLRRYHTIRLAVSIIVMENRRIFYPLNLDISSQSGFLWSVNKHKLKTFFTFYFTMWNILVKYTLLRVFNRLSRTWNVIVPNTKSAFTLDSVRKASFQGEMLWNRSEWQISGGDVEVIHPWCSPSDSSFYSSVVKIYGEYLPEQKKISVS